MLAGFLLFKEGILKGLYKFRPSTKADAKAKAQLFGSGAILNPVLKAQEILEADYQVAADVWCVTSYNQLRRDALEAERTNMLNPTKEAITPFITDSLNGLGDVFIFASDNMKTLPDAISKWVPGPHVSLGTDGFGRSDSRAALRDFFEVDYRHIVFTTLGKLFKEGHVSKDIVLKASKDLSINPDKLNPMVS